MAACDMFSHIHAQLHFWPWSLGIREETVDLTKGSVSFSFWGSPVISISNSASLFLPQRHEKFVPFGSSFSTLAGEHRLYEVPHGVMATKNSSSKGHIKIYARHLREEVFLEAKGAKPRRLGNGSSGKDEETTLARDVLAWFQFFDDLIEETKKAMRPNKLPWSKVEGIFEQFRTDRSEPRMALIVDISHRMSGLLPVFVNAARKILLRERCMLPATRVAETDTASLQWFVRQPGDTIVQKAGANRHRLLGVARRECFDTLENRVLKDFLFRCAVEGGRYLKTEVEGNPSLLQSKRATGVRKYRHMCAELHQVSHLKEVSAPPPVPRPNYVLQNDFRYKQIWHHYMKLLRREDEEDCLWDWQGRTWADVARFLVNAALMDLCNKSCAGEGDGLVFEELLSSSVYLLNEQRLGCRIGAGSEPGPFVVRRRSKGKGEASILEVVHPDHAQEHSATRFLGRLGGHLYLVLTPLTGGTSTVVVVWTVHTAGSGNHPEWSDIGFSAGRALQNHIRSIDDMRSPNMPILKGFVLASDVESEASELHPGSQGGLHLVQVAADQRCWQDALAGITAIIEVILGEAL